MTRPSRARVLAAAPQHHLEAGGPPDSLHGSTGRPTAPTGRDSEGSAERHPDESFGALLARAGALFAELGGVLGDVAQAVQNQLAETPKSRLMEGPESPMNACPETPSPGPLLTVSDVAARLQVDARTVRRWRCEGRLPGAIEIAGVVRWRPEVVETWLAEREAGS